MARAFPASASRASRLARSACSRRSSSSIARRRASACCSAALRNRRSSASSSRRRRADGNGRSSVEPLASSRENRDADPTRATGAENAARNTPAGSGGAGSAVSRWIPSRSLITRTGRSPANSLSGARAATRRRTVPGPASICSNSVSSMAERAVIAAVAILGLLYLPRSWDCPRHPPAPPDETARDRRRRLHRLDRRASFDQRRPRRGRARQPRARTSRGGSAGGRIRRVRPP